MKTSILLVGKLALGILLVLAITGVGFVGAETYRRGGSTAIIQQSDGSGPSESEVKRYQDGHKIITQDGSSTDITIQRDISSSPYDTDLDYLEPDTDRFERRFMEERFSRTYPDD